MKTLTEFTLVELASHIATHLEEQEIPVALVGGSCVAIYATGQYTTKDLDFIELVYTRRSHLRAALALIGFTEHPTGRYFTHPDTGYFLEFPTGPLSIGGEPVPRLEEITTAAGIVRLLTPTDCIKDRLAAFYYWNDQQALQQAIAVAMARPFDQTAIENWSAKEKMQEQYKKFDDALKQARKA